MKKFSDFGIKPKNQGFVGDKIKMMKIINQEITVVDYKTDASKYENSKICLQLQIKFKGEYYVLFTGSRVLANMIEQVPKYELPFLTTIIKQGEAYQFS